MNVKSIFGIVGDTLSGIAGVLGALVSVGILSQIGDIKITELIDAMKTKDFSKVRKWVVDNIDNDHTQLFRKIYEGTNNTLTKQSVPQAVLVLAEYQYKAAFVADHEINLTACLTELMMHCEFK